MKPAHQAAWTLAGLSALALAIQFLLVPIDADVSWLITVSERVLGGQRLYVEVFEVNPPASVWLYLPQVALAHALAMRPETLIVMTTTIAALATSALTIRLCRGQDGAPAPLAAAVILGFVTLILPGGLYAQREHYALLLMLPVAAVMARIAQGRPLAFGSSLAGGAAAGLVIVIKPFFVFAIMFPALYAAVAGRSWKSMLVAGAGAAMVVIAYGAAIMLAAPEYLAAVPMLAEIYGPMRQEALSLVFGTAVLVPAVAIALAWVLRPGRLSPFQRILGLAIAGFTIAVLIQGKGYWNHALPGLGLGLVMMAWSVFSPRQISTRARAGAMALTAFGAALVFATLSIQPPKGLVAAIKVVAPPNPTMVTLGTELATGHPAVRLVDGQWAGSRASLFTAAGVRYRMGRGAPKSKPEFERWYRDDIDLLAAEIRSQRPDVVLVEDKPLPWLSREPAIRAAMRNYIPASRAGDIAIWIRRPTQPSNSSR